MKLDAPARVRSEWLQLLSNRNFVLLWCGQAISNLGDVVFDTTLVLWIATFLARGQAWAPLAVSGVFFATAVPTFIFGPVAGVFADRWNKRRTLLAMDGARAILIGLLALVAGILPFFPGNKLFAFWQLGAIYVIVFLASLCAQLFNPARFALSVDIVEESLRPRSSSLTQMTMNIALIIGSPLAAVLLFDVGAQWALLLNALSFAVSFITILLVRLPQIEAQASARVQKSNFLREFGDGLHFLAKHRALRTILLTMCLLLFSGGISSSLSVFFATQNLHLSPRLYGLLNTATGAGLLTGAVLASWGVQRLGLARSFSLGILLIGLMEIVYARLTSFPVAFVFLFLQGIPNVWLNVAFGPLVMKVTPRAFLGRIWALLLPAMNLATMISTLLAGSLVSTLLHHFHVSALGLTFGPIDTLMTVSGMIAFAGGLYALARLRND